MKVMDSNKVIFQNRFSHLIGIIEDTNSIPDTYQVTHSRDDRLNLNVYRNERIHSIYSKYNSEREITMWLNHVAEQVKDSHYILMNGFGFGYHLEAFIKRFPDKRIFIYEPDPYMFFMAAQHINLNNTLGCSSVVDITVGSDEEMNKRFLNQFTDQVSESFVALTIPISEKLYESEIQAFNELAIQITKMKRSNIATYMLYAQDWISNICRNIKYIAKSPDVTFLENKFAEFPAVIVGSGPSLQYDLEMLKSIKNKVIIIAAGTSTQALLAANIEPDIIVSMDGSVSNLKAFQSIHTEQIPIIFGSFIHPEIVTDNHLYISHTFFESDRITPHLTGRGADMRTFQSNYSVTGLCIQLAAYMGCQTVVFTGQDLSFPNRQYYSRGVNHVEPEVATTITNDASMVIGNVFGQTNYTNHTMFVTLRDIENLIQLFPGVQFINASQHGAVIKGTVFQTLEELNYAKLATRAVNFIKDLFDSAKVEDRTPEVIAKMQRDLQELSKLRSTLDRLLKQINRVKSKRDHRDELIAGLNKVAALWTDVSKNKTYQVYVSFGLISLLNSYQRYILELNFCQDPKDKFNIIDRYLKALSERIVEFIPSIELTLKDSIQLLKEQK